MNKYFTHWEKVGTWSFKEAACIFAGINPRKAYKIHFTPCSALLGAFSDVENESDAMRYYHILLFSNWDKFGGLIEEDRADQDAYIDLILENEIEIPTDLKSRWKRFQQKANESKRNGAEVQKPPEKGHTQRERERQLNTYLLLENLSESENLDFTRKELWDSLSRKNFRLFPSNMRSDSINKFFQNQSYCKFRIGRRKG